MPGDNVATYPRSIIFPTISPQPTKHPLYVDLDGTLIRSDTLQQAWLMLLRRSPLAAIRSAIAFRTDRLKAKAIIAHGVDLDPVHLPYRPEVIDYVQRARADGRRVVLATGSTRKYAEAVAKHLGLFDAVFATEREGVNLISKHKLEKIIADAGGQPFEYLGDSHADVVVFEGSAIAGWVGGRKLNVVKTDPSHVHRLAPAHNDSPADLLRVLRPSQWLVNLLVFLPVLMDHQGSSRTVLTNAIMAGFAMSAVASAGCIVEDLLEIDLGQQHPLRRHRPIASGAVTLSRVVPIALALFAFGLVVAALINRQTLVAMLLFFLFTIAYSMWLKRPLLVGLLTLTVLLTARPVIGMTATGMRLSPIVMTTSIGFFAVLASFKLMRNQAHHARPAQP